MESDNCVFCQIVLGKIPSKFVYQDEQVVAFNDVRPSAPVHVLVVPKKHISSLSVVSEEDKSLLGHLQWVIKKLAQELGISQAFRVALNSGAEAGQVIFHLHYHLLGGFKKGGITN